MRKLEKKKKGFRDGFDFSEAILCARCGASRLFSVVYPIMLGKCLPVFGMRGLPSSQPYRRFTTHSKRPLLSTFTLSLERVYDLFAKLTSDSHCEGLPNDEPNQRNPTMPKQFSNQGRPPQESTASNPSSKVGLDLPSLPSSLLTTRNQRRSRPLYPVIRKHNRTVHAPFFLVGKRSKFMEIRLYPTVPRVPMVYTGFGRTWIQRWLAIIKHKVIRLLRQILMALGIQKRWRDHNWRDHSWRDHNWRSHSWRSQNELPRIINLALYHTFYKFAIILLASMDPCLYSTRLFVLDKCAVITEVIR